MIVTPAQGDINIALRTFLSGVLPDGVPVIAGQTNRVPEPNTNDFVVMWPINRIRLATNFDKSIDVAFAASIAGSVMTVTSISFGKITNNVVLFGVDILDGTLVISGGTGNGGVGTYNLNKPQNVASRRLACGVTRAMQSTEVVMQLDVHGPASSDNVQIISTMLRDEYGVKALQASNLNITPLFSVDPRQIPFINAEGQYETRWIVEAHLQVNQTVIVPQQFADEVDVDLIPVDAFIPPLPGPGTDASLDYSKQDNSMYQSGLI